MTHAASENSSASSPANAIAEELAGLRAVAQTDRGFVVDALLSDDFVNHENQLPDYLNDGDLPPELRILQESLPAEEIVVLADSSEFNNEVEHLG